jgi:hypothetical protein
MDKIVCSESGPIPEDPVKSPAVSPPEGIEVTVTPDPKTKAQRQANDKASGLTAAQAQQQQNAYQRPKLSKWQKKAQRKREREAHYKAIQADLASGAITEEQAKKMLPQRQQSATDRK